MNNIIIKSIDNKNEWESFLDKHEEANFLQSWNWGEFHNHLNKVIDRRGFYKNKKLVGVMLSIVENARRGRYLTVPGGPIIDWSDKDVVDEMFTQLKNIAKTQKCVFARIRPQIVSHPEAEKLFQDHGCKSSQMHLHAELSNILDITKSEDELLANMRKTTRYEIKKAEKLGIKIESSRDESLIRPFYDLQMETARRHKFVPFSYEFFREQFKVFFDEHKAYLYTAKFEQQILAQAFVIFYGKEAVYHYGASTQAGRKYPGAYLLQWEAIKEAKRRGLTRYNFWGVAPESSKDHRFYGVSVFKRGFGGEDIEYLHAQDLIINRPGYLLNYLIEAIRKKARRV